MIGVRLQGRSSVIDGEIVSLTETITYATPIDIQASQVVKAYFR